MSSPEPPIPLERVLEHTGWARALAYRLVHDHALSEDLVQEMIVRAMRSPPRRTESVRGWVRTVVRNLVTSEWRARASRVARESAASPAVQNATADEIHERLDLHRHVAAAVATLEAPLAEVIYLRYFEGLMPQAIAKRLGIAVPTVHGRLRRAHEILRVRLREEADDRGRSLGSYLGPLVAGLPAPTAHPGDGVPRSGSPSRLPVRLAATAGIVLLGSAAWLGMQILRPTDPSSAGRRESVEDGVAGTGASASRPRAGANRTAPADAGVTGAATAPSGVGTPASTPRRLRPFDVHVTGAPESGRVRVQWTPVVADPSLEDPPAHAADVVDGRLELDLGRVGSVANPLRAVDIVADDPQYVPVVVRVPVPEAARHVADGRAAVVRAAHVTGAVQTEGSGVPVRVGTFRFIGRAPRAECVDVVDAAADGTFRLRLWPGEEQWVAAVADDHVPFARCVTATDDLDLGTVVLQRGAAVQGTVWTADGSPLPGAATVTVVDVRSSDRALPLLNDLVAVDGGVVRLVQSARRADGSGAFRIGGFQPGAHWVRLSGLTLAGDVANASRRQVVLPVEGVDLRFAGEPVHVTVPEGAEGRLLQVSQDEPPGTAVRVDGRVCTVLGNPRTRYEFALTTTSRLRWVGVAEPVAAGVARSVTLHRADVPVGPPSVIEFRVPADSPVTGLHVAVYPKTGEIQDAIPVREARVEVFGGAGSLSLEQSGPHRVVVSPWITTPARADFVLDHEAEVTLAPGVPQVVSLEPRLGGRLRILAHDARGLPVTGDFHLEADGVAVPVQLLQRTRRLAPAAANVVSPTGVTDVSSPLAPGTYVVRITRADGTVRTAHVTLEVGRESVAELTFP
jgi:RNA polymerase sigma-70 factor (ECF subfamily)